MLTADMLASSINGPENFFYFSGYGSGLKVKDTYLSYLSEPTIQKRFSFCGWFRVEEPSRKTPPKVGYPILFSVYFGDSGGFECFLQSEGSSYKLLYRILPS